MYLFDTHVHTDETSPCGKVKAVDVVKLYKKAGYSGIIITDHYYKEYFDSLSCRSWEEKIDKYLTGYKLALGLGNQIGLKVFLGMELRFNGSFNDYLVYGIDEEYLKKYPRLYDLGLKNFKESIEAKDILVFQAHPYRTGLTVSDPLLLDGVEVFNGNPRHDSRNNLAYSFAVENNLRMLSGSDFHQKQDLARGGIEVSENTSNSKELVKLIKQDRITKLLTNA